MFHCVLMRLRLIRSDLLTRGLLAVMVSLLTSWALAAPSGKDTFRIGIAPHTSARVIIETYQPLRHFLEKSLERPVEIQTAPDFTEFARRGMNKEYDLAITTGHQARLLQNDAAYIPLVTYKADFRSVVVVPEHAKESDAHDFANKTVIGLNPSSLVTIWGQNWLKFAGVNSAKIRYVSAADSMGQLLVAGEGAAGFMSLANYQNLPPFLRSQLRILVESAPMVGRVYLLNGKHQAIKDRVDAALWAFAETPEGKAYFTKNKLDGYKSITSRDLLSMDPHANEVRKILKQTAK